jgi:hypothetical protein
MSDRDLFFAEVCDGEIEREPFTVPTKGGDVTVDVEEIDDAQYIAWQVECAKAGLKYDPDNPVDLQAKARLIIRCVYKNGKPFFKPEDAERLSQGRLRYIEPLYQLCFKVNRLGSFADLKKKSDSAQPSTSSSNSAGSAASGTGVKLAAV